MSYSLAVPEGVFFMPRKRLLAEQIITKLREAEGVSRTISQRHIIREVVGGGSSGQLPNKALIAPQEVVSVAFAARKVNSNSE